MLFIVFFIIVFLTGVIYTLLYDTNNPHTHSDSTEVVSKNNDEVIALWTLVGLITLLVIIFCVIFILNFKGIYNIKPNIIPYIATVCFGILSIVSTGISWDYFGSRYRDTEKNSFMALTLIQIISLLYFIS